MSQNRERKYSNSRYRFLKHQDFIICDLLAIEVAYFLSVFYRFQDMRLESQVYLELAAWIAIAFVVIIVSFNMYSGITRRNVWHEMFNVLGLCTGVFGATVGYCFFTKQSESYSRVVVLIFWANAYLFVLVTRVIRKRIVRKRILGLGHNFLLFAPEKEVERILDKFTVKANSGILINGIITTEPATAKSFDGIPVVCDASEIEDYICANKVSSIYMYHVDKAEEYTEYFVHNKIAVYSALHALESASFRYSVEKMNSFKTLCVREKELSLGHAFLKRVEDVVGSLFGLIITLWATIPAMIAIKMEDGGPIFYKCQRVGKDGKIFSMYKLRTMKMNADRLEDMLTPVELERYYQEYKLENDPRITKVGAFLRKYSIDEIPQFINIMKGDMSFVGPRPLVEDETYKYGYMRDTLLSIKPGLTGYWQAYGRNNVTYESGERQRMELYYVENADLMLDVKILFKTVKAVLSAEGAG